MQPVTAGVHRIERATDEKQRLKDSIQETVDQMGDTISALQDRLRPERLVAEAKTRIRGATIGKVENMMHEAEHTVVRTGHSLADRIRANPVPFAMCGIGLTWFLVSSRREVRYSRDPYERETWSRREPRRASARFRAAEEPELASPFEESPAEPLKEAASDLKDEAASAVEHVKQSASDAATSVREAARHAGQKVKRAAHDVTERGRDAEHRVEDFFHENPLAVGAVALAVGTIAGLVIPGSRKEDRWMGPTRDRLMGKAGEMAHEAIEKVEEKAREVQETAHRIESAAREVGRGI
ncbi:MAG: DUF3618 domain-containing protein [Polyangiaceae bacterium]